MAMRSFSYTTNSYSFSSQHVDEDDWIENLRKSVVDDQEETNHTPVSIFTVPKVLLTTDPESYIPQQVALGPFHHWRPEVFDMQRYKIAAARRTQKHMHVNFEHIVETMKKNDEAKIRHSYHNLIDMSGDALIWMMAVDMAFLLEFLQVYYYMKEEGPNPKNNFGKEMSHLVDVRWKNLSHVTILRDLVMMENQIPLFLIMTMLEQQCKRNTELDKSAKEILNTMLMGLYLELSPFQDIDPKNLPHVDINDCNHLLDFLYHLTVPNNKESPNQETKIDIEHDVVIQGKENIEKEDTSAKKMHLKGFYDFVPKNLLKSKAPLVSNLKKLITWKPMVLLMMLPKQIKEPILHKLENFLDGEEPKIEEIKIPSVTQMAQAGIKMSPVKGGISDIRFDKKTSTLYLPVVNLGVNTEVYLRNLVAYEACVAAGPLVVARFTELMNGIIDTEEDAKFLREREIVVNKLKSDKEVAELWNGMSKCVKLTKVHKMDQVIKDVNERYAQTWRVKMANYVYGSWKFLTVLAALCMLLLTMLQSFCSVYTCTRVFHHLPDIQVSQEN